MLQASLVSNALEWLDLVTNLVPTLRQKATAADDLIDILWKFAIEFSDQFLLFHFWKSPFIDESQAIVNELMIRRATYLFVYSRPVVLVANRIVDRTVVAIRCLLALKRSARGVFHFLHSYRALPPESNPKIQKSLKIILFIVLFFFS